MGSEGISNSLIGGTSLEDGARALAEENIEVDKADKVQETPARGAVKSRCDERESVRSVRFFGDETEQGSLAKEKRKTCQESSESQVDGLKFGKIARDGDKGLIIGGRVMTCEADRAWSIGMALG
ncbi:hypothetical protein Dimus_021923 [Dionaea muscipula]